MNERKILPMLSEGLDAISTFDKSAKAAQASTKALAAAGFEEQSDKSITTGNSHSAQGGHHSGIRAI